MSRQTKCPNCQTIYPMPDAKLGDPNVRAKCGKCQQVFFLNANLIPTETTPSQTTNVNPPPHQSVAPTQNAATKQQATPAADTTKQSQIRPAPNSPSNNTAPHQTSTPRTRPQSQNATLTATSQRAKRTKPLLDKDMIHDDMDNPKDSTQTAQVTFFDDELDNFLNENISSASYMTKSTKDEIADNDSEAWINDLLDDSKSSATQASTPESSTPIINDVDLNDLIPAAAPKAKKPLSIKRFKPNKPTAQQIATKKSLWSQLFWLLGCLLLIGLLGVQYMLFNMDKVAKNPTTANFAHKICAIIQCHVPSADLGSFDIESTLENQKDIIIRITNKSNTEQLFPYLLVRLKDENGVVVADFVADTKDYLNESQTMLLANQYIRIMLSTPSVAKASSVTVTPFYERP